MTSPPSEAPTLRPAATASSSPTRAPHLAIPDDHPLAAGKRGTRSTSDAGGRVHTPSSAVAASDSISPTSPGLERVTTTGSFNVPDADLLGIGPSRPAANGRRARDSPARPRSFHALDSLARDEITLLDTRFEDMPEADLASFLTPFERGWEAYRPQEQEEEPLFPPSPPATQRDHPVKVLSRAVRELREVVARLEQENARLRGEERRTSDTQRIHDSLADALSTSLASPARGALALALAEPLPQSQLKSAVPIRPKSPTPSHASILSTKSTRSTLTLDRPRGASATGPDLASPTARRWGMNMWGWRPQRKSNASVAPSAVEEEDEWRRGDGGSTPALRAIFLATRILTPDPASILLREAEPLVASLAHTLVSGARDAGIMSRDPPGRARARSRAASVGSQQASTSTADAHGYGDHAIAATVAVGRTLLKHGKAAIDGLGEPARPRPALLHRASSRPFPTTAMAQALPSPDHSPNTTSPSADTPPPSVELSSIVPDETRPPTVLLSRQNLGSFFQSSRTKLTTATRFTSDQPPLTDRYGFIYDIQHASMLKDASRVGTPAPMSLTGHIPEAPRKPTPPPAPKVKRAAALPSSLNVPIVDHTPERRQHERRPTLTSTKSDKSTATLSPQRSPAGTPPNGRVDGTPSRARTRSYAPAPSKPITAAEQVSVSVRGASSGIADGSASAAAAAAASRLTVSSLLDQLTDIHDKQQRARTAEWDAFLRKRTRGRRGNQDVGVGGALAQVVALGGTSKGAEEYRAFLRLVRKGIPMPYRGDVWAECSGARDLLVPGEYAEILSVHKDDRSPVMTEIEKDVGRTFPGNVFFGGDGPGVAKLRRVLTAYSWHNPAVGYCQGMNMLTATLLLTYEDEEQAFWVLHCIIERLLPADFYSPSLLGSRADQLVLSDLVTAHLPKISQHLAALGVDLTALTFGWFLSLFTDCLPVETLFRVWDVLLVEGHDVLFRVALAVLKLNEADICACESVGDLFSAIGGITSRLWSADKLVSLQHGFKRAVQTKDVLALTEKRTTELQGEMDGWREGSEG
ncbi:hypothetical protein CcaverHIS002_0104510 [Cutaneotrichosporon cavernicola]|uniref:Rab-GAP TBC domain-containing protein n=1 Tax=Cutaneotrichosporon cavernicola TaxID=279322 RepID=A0AA48L0L7_9TREE|nr:uncharacterized protein CcaverHIS019_0104450 [Cutaneotrichosporon cavernicola]BEI79922.1 hypothetical protein CcaverHIS002_0104510 [Cutaneotrichosporon cavernicola]BEI87727.1 hypothetical protein CcaverHIS019_0104450 [Cutaneotrichosporon cavernicola]BEI95498.1 hypothetical protein CcaverHIS631_0104470 [Cutaneotrichosporon cavernicola]BEJ03272.1 hypothetical protein CcaverHIS641_0104470 [Cutaneotrichosporon cavernicola]